MSYIFIIPDIVFAVSRKYQRTNKRKKKKKTKGAAYKTKRNYM
jgi:hypothetical protein